MKILQQNKNNINEIVAALKNGAVLVCPTDTVYGLICDAKNKKAVEKIFEIKKRDRQKPLAVFVKNIEQAKALAVIGKKEEDFLKQNWPGAVTVILKAKGGLPSLLYKNGTIGLRMPKYELLGNILKEFDGPMAQTSANISDESPVTESKEILRQFSEKDVIIIDAGDLPKNKPSTIIDLTNNKIKIIRK